MESLRMRAESSAFTIRKSRHRGEVRALMVVEAMVVGVIEISLHSGWERSGRNVR